MSADFAREIIPPVLVGATVELRPRWNLIPDGSGYARRSVRVISRLLSDVKMPRSLVRLRCRNVRTIIVDQVQPCGRAMGPCRSPAFSCASVECRT